jgi:arabinan endo-1,5-alpha-L-arabinosidase
MLLQRADIHIRDPFVLPLPAEGRYLLFGTTGKNAWSGPGLGFDCYSSTDLENWDGPIPAFRAPADFWSNTQFWAPECHEWKGSYYLFASFAMDERQRGTQILISDRPEGPYRVHSDGPVTPRDWESLDGTLYVDDADKPWMVFCHEWVQCADGGMCAMPLSDDLKSAIGEPVLLFNASAAVWAKPFIAEGIANNYVTDGPFLYRGAGGRLFMLWSTSGYDGYAMGYAISDNGSIAGPWRQSPEPIYSKDGGHGMLFHTFDGKLMMTLHKPNSHPDERPMWMEIEENDGKLVIK